MANVVRKIARYLSASANRKFDERADPRVQIDQAIDEARRQHEALVQQAALVVGNQRQLEMRLSRQAEEVANLTESACSSLMLADNARAAGDPVAAASYEETAAAFANQLVSAETSLEDLKNLHGQAVSSAAQARTAVEDNTARMQRHLAERARLLTQIEHAAMQEQMTKAVEGMSTLAPPGDTPSLAEIRDKVEHRYAVALGRHELASQGMEARMIEVRRATLDARAQSRLAQLRGDLAGGGPGSSALGAGGASTAPPLAADPHRLPLTKGSQAGESGPSANGSQGAPRPTADGGDGAGAAPGGPAAG
ncbi:PspA/IM30 family protein [Frankia sp. AgB32]|uniref:PspA/IM30 family protein n=1 Tax=Frankia sp. AgB32 TaxID=631119 RepID=UPI00200E57E1|nr:PspA/IM30 family protein [Frankia sp. AgB32]MCK9897389.1 PspA/IM30 family protein [Frankia sp. AgB32]